MTIDSGEGKTYFNNEECTEVVRNCHIYNLIIGASYFLVDTFSLFETIKAR